MHKFKISQKYIEQEYKRITEILDKYVKVKILKSTKGDFSASFLIPAIAGLNDTGQDITYTVKLHDSKNANFFTINNSDGKGGIRCNTAVLVFSNNMSNMAQVSANGQPQVNASIVFTTVVKCVDVYVQKFKPQSVCFSPYHEGLRKPYIILCKLAERQFKYKWINPNSINNRDTSTFVLVHTEIYEKWIANRVPKQ
jgi:hypothetical protein